MSGLHCAIARLVCGTCLMTTLCAFAAPVVTVECPSTCTNVAAILGALAESASRHESAPAVSAIAVRCAGGLVTVQLSHGSRRAERSWESSPEDCKALPQTVALMAAEWGRPERSAPPAGTERAAAPVRAPTVSLKPRPLAPAPDDLPRPADPAPPKEPAGAAPAPSLPPAPAEPPPSEAPLVAITEVPPPSPAVPSESPPAPVPPPPGRRGAAVGIEAVSVSLHGGVDVGPTVGFGELRVGLKVARHFWVGVGAGLSTPLSVAADPGTVTSHRFEATAAAAGCFNDCRAIGPRLTLQAGAERLWAWGTGFEINKTAGGWGPVFAGSVAWHQPLWRALFAQASVGALYRPAGWVLSVESFGDLTRWPNVELRALLGLGWSFEL